MSARSRTGTALLAAVLTSFGCGAPVPSPEPSARRSYRLALRPAWLQGQATMTSFVDEPAFGISVRLKAGDIPSVVAALGSNSPCFRVALVERCANGVVDSAVPRDLPYRAGSVGTTPIWCPAVDTAFEWSATFTDHRRVVGYPGAYQPLMRCQGVAEVALHLLPGGLRADASVLPRPGIPLEGLAVSDWAELR